MTSKDKHKLTIFADGQKRRPSLLSNYSDADSDREIRKKIQHGTRLTGVNK